MVREGLAEIEFQSVTYIVYAVEHVAQHAPFTLIATAVLCHCSSLQHRQIINADVSPACNTRYGPSQSTNEKEEQLEVSAWLRFTWRDENLRWQPSAYENVTDLRHPAGTLWQPDILLYNSVDPAFDSTYKVNLLNYHDGSVNWVPPGIFKISCKLDIYWFPFDEQFCFFKMRFILLEWAPWLLRMEFPDRKNTIETMKESWSNRKQKRRGTVTAFDFVQADDAGPNCTGLAVEENLENFISKVSSKIKDDEKLLERLRVLQKIHDHVK
ncbi:Neurotransmitter-gated ion-channel ligand binding domain protein, partial [Teladorsagia circumcincta]